MCYVDDEIPSASMEDALGIFFCVSMDCGIQWKYGYLISQIVFRGLTVSKATYKARKAVERCDAFVVQETKPKPGFALWLWHV